MKQGQSLSIGAKILSFVFRQLTEDFKEENTFKKICPISIGEGRAHFPEKVMSHYG